MKCIVMLSQLYNLHGQCVNRVDYLINLVILYPHVSRTSASLTDQIMNLTYIGNEINVLLRSVAVKIPTLAGVPGQLSSSWHFCIHFVFSLPLISIKQWSVLIRVCRFDLILMRTNLSFFHLITTLTEISTGIKERYICVRNTSFPLNIVFLFLSAHVIPRESHAMEEANQIDWAQDRYKVLQ